MTNRRWVILAAVAAAGLLPFHHVADQDRSRFCLTRALIGALGERLQAGAGASTVVAGTIAMPLLAFAATAYDQVPAAALLLGAFAAAWRGRSFAAGLAAGAAFLVEYQSGVAWAILLVYVAVRGARPAGRYLAGSLPFLVALGAYDWAAFGAPWHNPLRYSDNSFGAAHDFGVLGIHLPTLHGLHLVFV